jgi:ATP-dependent protease HslVU (ClpYQ) ATPase subunit
MSAINYQSIFILYSDSSLKTLVGIWKRFLQRIVENMCMRRLHGTMEHIINDLFCSSQAFEKMLFFQKDKSLKKTTNQSKRYNERCTQSNFVVIF